MSILASTAAIVSLALALLVGDAATGQEQLRISSSQLRALALAYEDLRKNLSGQAGEAWEYEAIISQEGGRFEIIFSRISHDGIERRGGGWYYVVGGSEFDIIERRPQK